MIYWFHRKILGHGLITETTDYSILRYCTCGQVWTRCDK